MSEFFQDVNPPAVPDKVTPQAGPAYPEGWAQVEPAGQGPAPYDISAPQSIDAIGAAVSAAGALSGAGVVYPQGPRQAAAEAFLTSPQGYGAVTISDGFPDYEKTNISPGANTENPITGQGPMGPPYPGTMQDGIPQYHGGEGAGVSGVPPEGGNMETPGGAYPGTTQDGLQKYGTS